MSTRLNHIKDWLTIAREAKWSVKRMAEIGRTSVRALELHFRETTGKTPKGWLIEQRMRLAQKFLRDGFLVKETADKLDYKHAQHFSRDFKKHWGFRPTQEGDQMDAKAASNW